MSKVLFHKSSSSDQPYRYDPRLGGVETHYITCYLDEFELNSMVRHLQGKILSLVDVAFEDKERRKIFKDLVSEALWSDFDLVQSHFSEVAGYLMDSKRNQRQGYPVFPFGDPINGSSPKEPDFAMQPIEEIPQR